MRDWTMSSPTVVVEVDQLAEAAYVRFNDAEVTRTVAFSDEINIDLDQFGVVVGIEVLTLGAEIPFSALVTDYHVESKKVDLLRLLRPSVATFVSGIQTSSAMTQSHAGVCRTC